MDNLLNEYKIQKRLLAEAIVEKEHMETYDSFSLKNDFVLKLGEPRYELHKLELTVARTKLKLDMLQTCINYKIPINTEQIDKQLEKEFESHYIMLKSMKKEIDNVRDMDTNENIIPDNLHELKEAYLSIANYIHPEFIDVSDKKANRIWKAAKKAYENGDAVKLKKLQKKVLNEYTDNQPNQGEPDIDLENTVETIKSKKELILSEIEKLKKQFPFNEAKLLQDEEAVAKFRNDIDSNIKVAKEVLDKLQKQILEKLPSTNRYLN
jgi:hypothetical protein